MAVYDFGDGICDLPPTLPPGLDDLNFVSAGFFRIQMQHGVDLSHLAKINHLAVVEIRVKRDLGFQRVRAELNRKFERGNSVRKGYCRLQRNLQSVIHFQDAKLSGHTSTATPTPTTHGAGPRAYTQSAGYYRPRTLLLEPSAAAEAQTASAFGRLLG